MINWPKSALLYLEYLGTNSLGKNLIQNKKKRLHFSFKTVFYLGSLGNCTWYLLPISASILNLLGLKDSKKFELGQDKRVVILYMLTNSKSLVPIPFEPSEFWKVSPEMGHCHIDNSRYLLILDSIHRVSYQNLKTPSLLQVFQTVLINTFQGCAIGIKTCYCLFYYIQNIKLR